MKKAFTLAEIMIVLVVIAIITSILLPAARHATPDENILKFKKAHNTLYAAIRELVNSDKYYLDGDLGVKPNGDLIDGTHDGDYTYFCESLAEIINTKEKKCSNIKGTIAYMNINYYENGVLLGDSLETAKQKADEQCKNAQDAIGAELVSNDIIFFQTSSKLPFGCSWHSAIIQEGSTEEDAEEYCSYRNGCAGRLFWGVHLDDNGFDRIYKYFCIDIDGIDKGEDPFGYGIRADGKIIAGARADEWLEKSINKKD